MLDNGAGCRLIKRQIDRFRLPGRSNEESSICTIVRVFPFSALGNRRRSLPKSFKNQGMVQQRSNKFMTNDVSERFSGRANRNRRRGYLQGEESGDDAAIMAGRT